MVRFLLVSKSRKQADASLHPNHGGMWAHRYLSQYKHKQPAVCSSYCCAAAASVMGTSLCSKNVFPIILFLQSRASFLLPFPTFTCAFLTLSFLSGVHLYSFFPLYSLLIISAHMMPKPTPPCLVPSLHVVN